MHDRRRHRPIRIEVDLDDLAVDFRRRPIRLTRDRGVARHRHAVLDRLDPRGRNVADHVAGREVSAERTQSREIDLELGEPHRRRHIERGQSLGANDAVDGQSMARLKAPHRGLNVRIVDIVAHRVRVDIAGGDQTRAQCGDARMAIAETEHFDAGHLGPAAATDNRRHSVRSPGLWSAPLLPRPSAPTAWACGYCGTRRRSPARIRRAGRRPSAHPAPTSSAKARVASPAAAIVAAPATPFKNERRWGDLSSRS